MIDHADMQKQLAAYCGDDLEPAARKHVEEHLAQCASCRAELADLQTALRLIRTTPEAEAPPWLAARIMVRVREQHKQKGSWLQRIFFPLHIKLPLEAVALLVVCVSGYYLTRSVETELHQPASREELPAVPETGRPAGAAKQESPAAAPSPSVLPTPTAKHDPVPEKTVPTRTVTPHDQVAPPHLPDAAGKPSPQPAFAPVPPARKEERAAPAAEAFYSDSQPGPEGQSAKRAVKATAEIKNKAPGTGRDSASESAAGAPAAAAPQVRIRLNLIAPAAAPGSLNAAITRAGGSVIDDHVPRPNTLKARIPSPRMAELLESLARLGTVVERPQTRDLPGIVVIEITW